MEHEKVEKDEKDKQKHSNKKMRAKNLFKIRGSYSLPPPPPKNPYIYIYIWGGSTCFAFFLQKKNPKVMGVCKTSATLELNSFFFYSRVAPCFAHHHFHAPLYKYRGPLHLAPSFFFVKNKKLPMLRKDRGWLPMLRTQAWGGGEWWWKTAPRLGRVFFHCSLLADAHASHPPTPKLGDRGLLHAFFFFKTSLIRRTRRWSATFPLKGGGAPPLRTPSLGAKQGMESNSNLKKN